MNWSQIAPWLERSAPELALTILLLIVIVADLFAKRSKFGVALIALAGLAGAAMLAAVQGLNVGGLPGEVRIFGGAAASDAYAYFFRFVFLASGVVVLLFSIPVVSRWSKGQGEFYALVIACTLGMCLMAMASDLLMMYLALEFVSVTSYVMAGLLPRHRKSAEASLKYIIYGSGASGMMIYGMTFLYGLTGSLQVDEVGRRLGELAQAGQGMQPTMALVVSVLAMAGFGYKIAAAPFHMWCPDVYEGAPTPITAFFSVGPKAAGFAMLARFVAGVFQTDAGTEAAFEWRYVLGGLAFATMAVGNFAALLQQNLKRLMAYSSIGHSGYLLLAFAVFEPENVASVLFYVVAYVLMNLGAFLVIIHLEEKQGIETVDGCRGLGWKLPVPAAMMTVFLFSLTGLPPTAGFVGKLMIFGYLVSSKSAFAITLAVAGVLFSVVSLYYYARIIAAFYLGKPKEGLEPAPLPPVQAGLLWFLGGATLVLGLFPGPVLAAALAAARSMFPGV